LHRIPNRRSVNDTRRTRNDFHRKLRHACSLWSFAKIFLQKLKSASQKNFCRCCQQSPAQITSAHHRKTFESSVTLTAFAADQKQKDREKTS
jgi:hypothetical protein